MNSEKDTDFAEKLAARRVEKQRQLGGRLRSERKRLGLSLIEFARRVGVHRNTQANYESGQREPDQAYYVAIKEQGIRLTYIQGSDPIEDLPSFAASIAEAIFRRAGTGAHPEALAALFFLFALNEVHVQSGFTHPFNDDQATALVVAAFAKGPVFFEGTEAVAKYALRLTDQQDAEEISPHLRAELILEAVQAYDVAEQLWNGIALRDAVMEITENLVVRRLSAAIQHAK